MLQGGFILKKLAALIIGLLLIFSAASSLWAQDTVHVVKKGDTLWDITRHYLSNPWKWPVIWSNNQDITNPHLIFPGDRVVISTKAGKTTITIIPAKGGQPAEYTPAGAADVKDKTFMISPQYSAYIFSPNALTGSGTVAKKAEQGVLITRNEGIVIKSKSGLAIGKIVTIVTKVTEAKDKDVVKGYLYKAIGFAKVEHAQGSLYKATVLDSSQEIHLGDLIFDDVKAIEPMKVKLYEPSLKGSGRVMDLYGGTVHGSSYLDLIFLNVGKNDGVDQGAVVSLYKELTVEGEPDTLRDYRGNALVLQALDNSSLALVTESLVPIQRDFVVLGAQ
jgi:hypothetical protein